ncbi:TraM recognition domain-containing protein [Corynebacterium sp. USCH3]|uniref:type IV secretory system conjugative DNA transfer family protein n=1 Tax=Corynebacterium sp. USCH3 TaxID=3024840 RepID=UPI003096973E
MTRTYTPPPTPYGGVYRGRPAQTGPHLLVSGPSGVGKSRRVLGPGIIIWGGPVVAVSSKPDLIDLCMEKRLSRPGAHGRTFVLDLSGEVTDAMIPDGAERVVVDPVALIDDDDAAIQMASVLMKTGSAGAGDGGKGGDAFWETTSTAPLAAILRAADDVSWALRAMSRVEAPEDGDADAPCWINAVGRLDASPILADELASVATWDGKMRDSVTATMRSAVAPWLQMKVRGRGTERIFTPDLLGHRRATLFMVAPADGVAAGAATAVVDFVTSRWRKSQTEPEETRLPRLLLCVDELCNTLPWPKLPTVVTESRAMGINLLVAVQATSQFAKRYGRDGMEELREVFPSVLVLTGAPEKEMLEHATWWAGASERQSASMDARGQLSQQGQQQTTFESSQLMPTSIDTGRLLRGRPVGDSGPMVSPEGLLVDLADISQM